MTIRMMPTIRMSGVRLPGTKIANATIAAMNATSIPVAVRLATSIPASSNGSFTGASRGLAPTVDGVRGALARHPVCFQTVGDVVNVPGAGIEGVGRHCGDGRPRDAAVEEGRHRDLVGPA